MAFEAIYIVIIMFSIILHEVAHGYSAYILGDSTAKNEGRLTLNPVPHVDILGTIIIPAALVIMSTGFIFGWAKPVPYNPYNLRGKFGEAIVAAAGPLTNIGIALIFAIAFRLTVGIVPEAVSGLFVVAVFINLFLAILNLLPVPPLDGAKVFSALLPVKHRLMLENKIASFVNVNSIIFMIIILLFIVFFLLDYLVIAVQMMSSVLLGSSI